MDDMALVATAGTFKKAHQMLGKMMAKSQCGYMWSKAHNSRFKMSKSVLVDFSRSKHVERPNMTVMITMDFGISPGCYQVGGVKTLNYSGNSVVR